MIDCEIFTEQAEYIEESNFKKWTISHPDESTIIKKLTQGGAKLITGPRGCGKTTLMLKAFNECCYSQKSKTLPIYVNFKSSLKLEPLYKNQVNAAYWFNQWLLLKVLDGLYRTIKEKKLSLNFAISHKEVLSTIHLLEMGRIDLISDACENLTLAVVDESINQALNNTGKIRCSLLLDDAGHAFSPEQQHDFFEFFREVKSKSISPKAAIYPGVTSYSSSFHVGHDAEEIDVWIRPNTSGYITFMHSLLSSRLNEEHYKSLMRDINHINFMCYASYGIPRALLNMVQAFCKEGNGDIIINKLDSKNVLKEVKSNFNRTYQIYESLKLKLPIYKNFIEVGAQFFDSCVGIIKEFNKGSDVGKQSSIIAIKRPISSELNKVIGFFQYSGLVSPSGISNRGDKGVYELYELNYSVVIDRNIFFSKRAINIENYITAFSQRPNHHYPRHTEISLIQKKDAAAIFSLALPPCEICKSPRASDEARFCMQCGARLKDASIFEEIVNQDINCLPITDSRARSIKSNSKIRKIKDILMDHDNRELRSVHMIGPIWAHRIRSYAEEFIS